MIVGNVVHSTETPTAKILGEKKFTKGDNLTLMCEISGRPFPVVYWFRADDDMRWPAESISVSLSIRKLYNATGLLSVFGSCKCLDIKDCDIC